MRVIRDYLHMRNEPPYGLPPSESAAAIGRALVNSIQRMGATADAALIVYACVDSGEVFAAAAAEARD